MPVLSHEIQFTHEIQAAWTTVGFLIIRSVPWQGLNKINLQSGCYVW